MPLLASVSRRSFLAGALAAPVAFASRGAFAAGDVYVHAGANFTPVTIAVTPLAGDLADARIGAVLTNDLAHSIFLSPLNPTQFPENVVNPDVRPNMDAWKTVNAQFVLTGRVGAASGGKLRAIPAVGHGHRRAGRRPAVHDRRRQFAPGRPSHR